MLGRGEDLHIWDGDFAVPIRCCPMGNEREREKRDEGECMEVFSQFT